MANKKSKKRVSRKINAQPKKNFVAVPLKGSFMLLAIVGFFVSAYLVYPKNVSYGFAFMLVFTAMFFASLISMTKAPIK